MCTCAGAGRALSAAAPVLLSAAETLAQIYHHVCAINGTQPERLLLEHAGQTDGMCASISVVPSTRGVRIIRTSY